MRSSTTSRSATSGSPSRCGASLGRYFGVETLERVFDPGDEGALARLRAEVSIYATENRREATAELFTEWWQNPRPRSAAATFGALVERYVTS